MDRVTFNQVAGAALRTAFQKLEREAQARAELRAAEASAPFSVTAAARRGLDAANVELDAAVMEFTDVLADALGLPDYEIVDEPAPAQHQEVVNGD